MMEEPQQPEDDAPEEGAPGEPGEATPSEAAPEEQPAPRTRPEETPAGSGEEHPGPEIGGMEELAQAAGEAEAARGEPAAEEPAPAEEPAAEEPAAEAGAGGRGGPARRAPAPRSHAAGRRKRAAATRSSRAPISSPTWCSRSSVPPRASSASTASTPRRTPARASPEAAGERPPTEEQPAALTPLDLAADARYRATGKRKSAVARVTLKPGEGTYMINGRHLDEYFPRVRLQRMGRQPLEATGNQARMDVVALIHGGGVSAQAAALRHGIARALVEADPALRGELKRRGYLTRDPRVKERKKAGLKKARKRPQFSKR